MKKSGIYLGLLATLWSCAGEPIPSPVSQAPTVNNHNAPVVQAVTTPVFNADSAFGFIEKQVSFGARVPNTKEHIACGDWLIETLKRYGAEVIVQPTTVKAYTGEMLKIRNIIAQFNPETSNRIALFAHWDTRPFSDQDPVAKQKPVLGADDGGSGVGVLLEIARNLQAHPIPLGVDIILFDGEDYGDSGGDYTTYCLGSQYWAKNFHKPGYTAKFGILLDMVGAKGAQFSKEGWSQKYAYSIVERVWETAARLGYQNYFTLNQVNPVTDDHFFVNTIARIPTINIINYNEHNGGTGFGAHWHTQNDNLDIIDKNTLRAVGQTVLEVAYSEPII